MTNKYPAKFLRNIQSLLGPEYNAFLHALEEPSPTSVRLNPFKPSSKFENEEKVPWCVNGRYLTERPSFTFDPLFHAGTYYVQEASSMFIEQVWNQMNLANQSLRVLDMCSAPGGKSTHLLSLMNSDSLLVSNEVVPLRNSILRENLTKWGTANVVVTQSDPKEFNALSEYFDVILIDAPCSGEGLFRKDKEAVSEWSEKNVQMCSARQKEILEHAWNCLKPGGYLIYSTCTYEPVENDENIQWLRSRDAKFCVSVPLETNRADITRTKFGLQFYPHKIKGEGFFISLVQKVSEANERSSKTLKPATTSNALLPLAHEYLEHPENFVLQKKGDEVFAMPASLEKDMQLISSTLKARQVGIPMGAYKGKDFIPSPQLALNNQLSKSIPSVELDYNSAISFLRCETVKANTEHRGWCLVKFEGHALGWVKVMDNRVNNYYPREWRILKQS